MNNFFATGNLADTPTLKYVQTASGDEPVAEMRAFFDRPVPDGSGGFKDKGGFWCDVEIWGNRAERCANLLRKGCRVVVSGTLVQERWPDKDTGEEKWKFCVKADIVALDLARIESVNFKAKAQAETPEPADAN